MAPLIKTKDQIQVIMKKVNYIYSNNKIKMINNKMKNQ